MTIDPLAPLRALLFCVIAFALGLLFGGVPSYFIGRSHGAASHLEGIGALKTTVDSCATAATESNKLVQAERKTSDEREQRMAEALAANARARPAYRAASDRAMAYRPKGNDECTRTVDTVRALVMGG